MEIYDAKIISKINKQCKTNSWLRAIENFWKNKVTLNFKFSFDLWIQITVIFSDKFEDKDGRKLEDIFEHNKTLTLLGKSGTNSNKLSNTLAWFSTLSKPRALNTQPINFE